MPEETTNTTADLGVDECVFALIGLLLSNPAVTKRITRPLLGLPLDPRAMTLVNTANDLDENGIRVDLNTIAAQLTRQGKIKAFGGPQKAKDYIMACRGMRLQDLTGINGYLRIIDSAVRLRNLQQLGSRIMDSASEDGADPDSMIGMIQDSLTNLRKSAEDNDILTLGDLMREQLPSLVATHEQGITTAITSTFPSLDREIGGGLRKGRTTLLKGPSNGGKTTLALAILFYHAFVENRHVVLISPEMTKDDLFYKFLALIFGVSIDRLCNGTTPDSLEEYSVDERIREPATWSEIKATLRGEQSGRYYERVDNIHLCTRSPITVTEVGNVFYQFVASVADLGKTIDLAVVDYIQLIESDKKYDNRQVEVDAIGRKIRAVMKSAGVHHILLSQVNEQGKARESNALYMHSDTVLLMEPKESVSSTIIHVEKGRMHKKGGAVTLKFNGALGIYEEEDSEAIKQAEVDQAMAFANPVSDTLGL